MALNERIDLIDFKWSNDGDWVIENGDIADTSRAVGQGFIQEVQDRIKSSFDDYKLLARRGANLDDFEGEINNEATWSSIESNITFSLTLDGFLDDSDFIVTVAPLSESEVAARVDFNTSLTNVSPDSKITVKVVYDLNGKGPFIIR